MPWQLCWHFVASHGCHCGSTIITDQRQMFPALPENCRCNRAKQNRLEYQHKGSIRAVQHTRFWTATRCNHCLSLSGGCKGLVEQPGLPGGSQGEDA